MALVLADRVKETTTTTGTGTITLAGAANGFRSFSAIGNGNTTYYCIAGQGTTEWEVGIGTYTSSGTTLSRDTVLSSSAGGTTKVNFSAGTKDVFVSYPASKSVYFDSNDRVGIGTSSPTEKLDVNGTVNATNITRGGSQVYSRNNILGTVSQSSSVPTGSIIERGSNANGSYIKYADGTMVAYLIATESRTTTGTLATVLTLPVTFIDEVISPKGGTTSQYVALATSYSTVPQTVAAITYISTSLSSITIYINRGSSTDTSFSLVIIGRWF